MTALPPQVAQLCGKIVGQLSSDNEGTVIAAGRALVNTLARAGLGISDLSEHITAAPREVVRYIERPHPAGPGAYPFRAWREASRRQSPNAAHREQVFRCQNASAGRLNEWEAGFLLNLAQHLAKGRALTPKQLAVLNDISDRFGVRI